MTDRRDETDDSAPPAPINPPNPIDETLGTEARIMQLPRIPDSAITEAFRKRLLEAARKHIEQFGLTHREIGRQIGLTSSVVSEILRGRYAGDADAVLRKIHAWLESDIPRRSAKRPLGFFPTQVFSAVAALAKFCKSNARVGVKVAAAREPQRIAIGWAPAGSGKTLAAEALAADDPNAILITIAQKRGTDVAVAQEIFNAARFRGVVGRRATIPEVISRLKGSARLLIIDEGHRLSRSGCEFIRDLVDQCGIPVLILATEEFYTRLAISRTRRGLVFYDQFSRRVGYVCDLLRGMDGRGGVTRPIYSLDEIRQIFRAEGLRLTTEAVDLLQAIACTPGVGMLGIALNIFDLAGRAAARHKHLIDHHLLRQAIQRVLAPPGDSARDLLAMIEATLEQHRRMAASSAPRASAAAGGA